MAAIVAYAVDMAADDVTAKAASEASGRAQVYAAAALQPCERCAEPSQHDIRREVRHRIEGA